LPAVVCDAWLPVVCAAWLSIVCVAWCLLFVLLGCLLFVCACLLLFVLLGCLLFGLLGCLLFALPGCLLLLVACRLCCLVACCLCVATKEMPRCQSSFLDDTPDPILGDNFGRNPDWKVCSVTGKTSGNDFHMRRTVCEEGVEINPAKYQNPQDNQEVFSEPCCKRKSQTSFENIPRETAISEKTLETLGVHVISSEPKYFDVTFQSTNFKHEFVRCKDLFPKPKFCIKKCDRVDKKTIFINTGKEISSDRRPKILELCAEFVGIFVKPPGPWKVSKLKPHEIDTGDCLPIRQPARRIPFHKRAEVEKATAEMLEKEVIQESNSAWQSPILLVKKPDGTVRFVVDYRGLNKESKLLGGKLPLITETLDLLIDSRYFSSLDLASGYWLMEMAEKDREKTAFLTHQGLFEFRVMPFGLKNAPFSFQKAMDNVLAGIQPRLCHVYLDDVICHSKTFSDHLDHLRLIFERFKDTGLVCQPRKCHFGKSELKYLGFFISRDCISVDPDKIQAVKYFAVPTDVKTLQGFLGLTGYYRRFVENYAKIAAPLHELTKDVPFVWTDAQNTAFKLLKEKLMTTTTLR
jgi:hypothetical protein